MRWERGENLREEDELNYSAARGKEQPCLLQLRLSVREDKKKRGKEIKKWEGWEFEKEKDEVEVKKASDGKEGSALSLDSCKIPPLPLQTSTTFSQLYYVLYHTILCTIYSCKTPPLPLQQLPTRALFTTILWEHKQNVNNWLLFCATLGFVAHHNRRSPNEQRPRLLLHKYSL